MNSSRRAYASIGACAAVVGMAGCGGAHALPQTKHPHASGALPNASARTGGPSAGAEKPAGTPIVSLPELGSLSYRCAGRDHVEATLNTRTAAATETATVEGDNGRHLRAATLNNPGPFELTARFASYHTLTWRVIQSTEPTTLEATVRLYFHPGAYPFGCSPTRWTSTVNVIGHGGRWSVPPAWP